MTLDQAGCEVTITEQAAKEFTSMCEDENKLLENSYLRVGANSGGCSGFTYTVDFDSRKSRFDLEFESFGLNVLVDKKSHLYIKGTEIDWSNDLNDRGLKFNNPSAKGSCGCRTSFMHEHTEQTNDTNPSWM